MKLSFAICTHNEDVEFELLYKYIRSFLNSPAALQSRWDFEIIVVDDNSTNIKLLRFFDENYVAVYKHPLDLDFASHKNFLIEQCSGDWILNLDADEFIPADVLANLPAIIDSNPLIEAYWFPRVNTVNGLTLKHVQKWGWVLSTLPGYRMATSPPLEKDEYDLLKQYGLIVKEDPDMIVYDQPIICWPDPQMRLFKRTANIRWSGKVHERLEGFENFSSFPYQPEWAIQHYKNIARQERQNNFYDTIQR